MKGYSVVATPWKTKIWKSEHPFHKDGALGPEKDPEVVAFERKMARFGPKAQKAFMNRWLRRYVVDRESAIRFAQLTGFEFVDRKAWCPYDWAVSRYRWENEKHYILELFKYLATKDNLSIAFTARPYDFPKPTEVDPLEAVERGRELIVPTDDQFETALKRFKNMLRQIDEEQPEVGKAMRKRYEIGDLEDRIELYVGTLLVDKIDTIQNWAQFSPIPIEVYPVPIRAKAILISPYLFTSYVGDIFNPDWRIARIDFIASFLETVGIVKLLRRPSLPG